MMEAIFHTIPYSLLQKGTAETNIDGGVNIWIDDPQFDLATIINYTRSHKVNFMFSLGNALVDDPNFEALFAKLYSLFAVSTFAGRPLINLPILQTSARERKTEGLDKLVAYFKSQGESVSIVTTDLSTNVTEDILFLNEKELKHFSEEQFRQYQQAPIRQVVLLPKTLMQQEATSPQIDLSLTNPWINLLFSKVTAANELATIQHQKALWQKRAQLYLSFLTLSKEIGESEYYGIKHWYHKEYEVLPLWYKQFGHIIKVLSGKRSFKSLFDKN